MPIKNNTLFECSKCGAQFAKWSGRCLECGAWGTLTESQSQNPKAKINSSNVKFDEKKLVDFQNISAQNFARVKTNLAEIDLILGGGIVKGGITLLGGEPGIGKSTLVLQILQALEKLNHPLLYVSGEESAEQIKLRLDRLHYRPQNLKFLSETNIEEILAAINQLKPALTIIDSIQTVYSSDIPAEAGNVSQIRAATVKILETAKKLNTPVIVTGHVTKDGAVAGPKTLEHLVDTVIYLEGEKLHGFRLLRAVKNRFGSTNEVGVLEMTEQGLREIRDAARIFLEKPTGQTLSGSALTCFMEGNRPFLAEVQALVSPTVFGFPQRKAAGYDLNRLQLIAAVLTKRAKLNLANQDIHINIAGGFKIKETAVDLAVAAAIHSALKDRPLAPDTIIIGEIGLGGEVRAVGNLEKRLNEAAKMGFKKAIVPRGKTLKDSLLAITQIASIVELLN